MFCSHLFISIIILYISLIISLPLFVGHKPGGCFYRGRNCYSVKDGFSLGRNPTEQIDTAATMDEQWISQFNSNHWISDGFQAIQVNKPNTSLQKEICTIPIRMNQCISLIAMAANIKYYCLAAQESLLFGSETKYVNTLTIEEKTEQIPTYRLVNEDGELLNTSTYPSIDKNLIQRLYKYMRTLTELDKVLYECQRQGRISFYMTGYGEEGVQIGSAAGLDDEDLVFPQYRETGVLLWRGFTINQCVDQCFGNKKDLGRGKQMPIHYGSKDHHYVTVSSPLGTQIPQAVGAAYSYKQMKNKKCTVVYFGEGAASEGDAHAAFNFAATLQCPVIFFCRNNGYAISTPASEQYKGDGIAGRGSAYGIAAVRVDGNDVLGVYNATKMARDYVVGNNAPIIIEAMTYRRGHHSTSDDSTAYRSREEIDQWEKFDPIVRLQYFMKKYDIWDEELQSKWLTSIQKKIRESVVEGEKVKKPRWQELFTDVYHDLPPHLQEQQRYMENHVKKYKQYYPVNDFEQS